MGAITFAAPTAHAAYVLVDLLGEECDVTATALGDSTWEVRVELDGAPRDTVPLSLSAARQWLAECELPAASVSLDGHTHLLRRERVSRRSVPSFS
jgi:hypothetical protein